MRRTDSRGSAGGGRPRGVGCVPPGGICSRGASVCFEPEPVVTSTNWSFVGPGQGGYERLNTYDYVGEGVGSYEKEPVAGGRRVSACCLGCLVAVALASLGGFLGGRRLAAASLGAVGAPAAGAPAAGNGSSASTANATASYDCKENYFGWLKAWSSAKKAWCCENHDRGCPLPDANATGAGAADPGRPAATLGGAGAVEEDDSAVVLDDDSESYDCAEGYSNWKRGWSTSKKEWCCREEGRGCRFDCDAGLANADKGWSAPKKLWCCEQAQKGCGASSSGAGAGDDVEALSAGANASVDGALEPAAAAGSKATATMTSTVLATTTEDDALTSSSASSITTSSTTPTTATTATSTTATTVTTTKLPTTTLSTTTTIADTPGVVLDEADIQDTTASVTTAGTTSSSSLEASHTFDCDAGLPNWEKGWSNQKKDWCCVQEQKGCEQDDQALEPGAQDVPQDDQTPEPGAPGSPQDDQALEPGAQDVPQDDVAADATTSAIDSDYAGGLPFHIGDPPPPPGCDSVCVKKGLRATCRQRVRYAADRKFSDADVAKACRLSHEYVVRQQCPEDCGACDIADTGCGSESET